MAEPTTLTLPATLASLERLRLFARQAAEQAGVDAERAYGLQLAIDEIATNVVTYGYGANRSDGLIEIRAAVAAGALQLTLADWGPPFDPRSQQMPGENELERPLEEREAGGLGIFLARRSVDRFDYRRVGDRNETVFEVRVGQRSEPEPAT